MSVSWTSICNLALIRIGSNAVSDITTGTDKSSVACNAVYEMARDEILERWDWKCARVRKEVTNDTTDPIYDYLYRYAFPSSPYCLAIRSIEDDPEFEIVGRYIECDEETPINITYTKRIIDPTELSPTLQVAIAMRVAHYISFHLAPSESLRQGIAKDLAIAVLEAKAAGALQEKVQDEDENSTDKSGAEWISTGR